MTDIGVFLLFFEKYLPISESTFVSLFMSLSVNNKIKTIKQQA